MPQRDPNSKENYNRGGNSLEVKPLDRSRTNQDAILRTNLGISGARTPSGKDPIKIVSAFAHCSSKIGALRKNPLKSPNRKECNSIMLI